MRSALAAGCVASAAAFSATPAVFGGHSQVAKSGFMPALRTAEPAPPVASRAILREGRPVISMAAAKKSVSDLGDADLKGKKVLIRCDLNVPLDGKKITDDTRECNPCICKPERDGRSSVEKPKGFDSPSPRQTRVVILRFF
jgi:hypothetical protein